MAFETFHPRKDVTIAFRRTKGTSATLPGVVFMGGFRSDMTGTKATWLEKQCAERNQSYVCFDYRGHGASPGRFSLLTIGAWLQDAFDVFDTLTEGPQIIVGSSMGGWIALLLARARPERTAGLIGIAAAPDFTEDIYNKGFDEEQRRHLAAKGLVYMENPYGDPYPLTRALFKEAKQHLLLKGDIAIHAPVRLIQGKKDAEVPWQKSGEIAKRLASADVKVILVDDGDHRLSREEDLRLIDDTVVELSRKHRKKLSAGS